MPRGKSKNTAVEKPGSDNGSGLIVMEDLQALELENLDEELSLMTRDFQLQPPRVRVEHSTTGRHRLFIDYGESYTEEDEGQVDLPGNSITGIVVMAQMIRAKWAEGEAKPACAAVEDKPTVNDPVHSTCIGCPENVIGSKCKPKVRLLVLTFATGQPSLVVFPLSPTSIKRWKAHVSKLARSKAPYIAVITRFTLDDTQKNGYRWAEVEMAVDRVVTKQELDNAMQLRDQFTQQLRDVDEADFQDNGDKVPL
ncbi:MAG: hypothetical protein P9L92_00525 [Candidatus Electryonea clarkiae]|nr:hypothetical protein [Candidatus Electryonea clarkiae]MDP8287034.1 hypothetical protein [Candidatus Electryonea clarkiae]